MSAGADFINMLVEMGFSKEKAEKGLSMTGHKGVEAAMEWIFSHPDELEPSTSKCTSGSNSSSLENSVTENKTNDTEDAKSIKCDDCGKLFKSQLEVEYHASKSGHSNFSESTEEKKPLTEEEKLEQLKKIEQKLKEKRKEREEREKTEALEKEKLRIDSGKKMTEAKKRMEELEMKKLIDQRKREKEEDSQARQRVKLLIEADKLARKGFSSDEIEKKQQEDMAVKKVDVPSTPNEPPKEYTQTRIQMRLPNGSTLTETFNVKEQLAAVRVYIEVNRTDGDEPFSLMTSFPKKVFSDEEYGKRLEDLNLVPSAVLIVTRNNTTFR